MKLFRWNLWGNKPKVEDAKPIQTLLPAHDPLDVVSKSNGRPSGWQDEKPSPFKLTVDQFPVYVDSDAKTAVMDSSDSPASIKGANGGAQSSYTVPPSIQDWYNSQGFIGYQACALIAQHWLVDKACSQSGEDSVRNGWEIKTDGNELSDEELSAIKAQDIEFKVKENLVEFNRFKNIFGIRVAIFEVESDDPKYYEKPFNIDGVTKGSYKGISQVDPYWMTPMMTSQCTQNPADKHFYDPEYWIISGKKYHRSHLCISRGPAPADILKPTYIFGGIPLVQRIYERVYAAERMANEAPLLALSKRTTAIHVDVEKAMANEESFVRKLLFWTRYRDNHAVKVLGKDESMEQFDTNLSDFDSLIMNQYQLVAAIAKTPATKILGTSPKGFNATGEFETVSYHEELESLHEHTFDPMLERHYLLTMKSFGHEVQITIVWNPVDSITTQAQAELNAKKAAAHEIYVNVGAVSPDEVRQALRDDETSGYNRLSDDDANTEPGASPENLAEFEKAGAEENRTAAEQVRAGLDPAPGTGIPHEAPTTIKPQEQPPAPNKDVTESAPTNKQALVTELQALIAQLNDMSDSLLQNGVDLETHDSPGIKRSVKPSVTGSEPNVVGAGAIVPASNPDDLPRIKLHDMVAVIENPRGSIRQGKNGDWQIKMAHHYGFIKGTAGADGDEVDCFIGPDLEAERVFVVNQNKQDGAFDEHKVMLGFQGPVEAKAAYHASYKAGWTGFGSMSELHVSDFKSWLASGDCKLPLGDI
jgi:phage-related protein (TIGR01555 family)